MALTPFFVRRIAVLVFLLDLFASLLLPIFFLLLQPFFFVIDRENRVVNFYLQFLFLSLLLHFQVNHTHKIEMSASYTTSKIPFEHYASQYRCCCNSVHVKQGTQIIAVIQTICAIFGLIVFVFSHKLDAIWGLLEIASILGEIIVLTILFLGIKKENPHFLLPYLVYEVSFLFYFWGLTFSFLEFNGTCFNWIYCLRNFCIC
jgi:hypothetical protein